MPSAPCAPSAPLLILLGVAALTPGCAQLIDGRTQRLHVRSEPMRAEVFLKGRSAGSTPLTLELERKRDHELELRVEGYLPTTLKIQRLYNPTANFNFVGCFPLFLGGLPGLVGFAVDFSSGAAYRLTPEEVVAYFERSDGYTSMSEAPASGLHLFVTLDPEPEWERVGTLPRASARDPRVAHIIEVAR